MHCGADKILDLLYNVKVGNILFSDYLCGDIKEYYYAEYIR